MKSLNKFLRKNTVINSAIRFFLRKGWRVLYGLQHRWPVSGNLEFQFEGLNFKYHAQADDPIVSALYYGWPYHETKDLKIFKKFAEQVRTIFDIGANTGLYSIVSGLANKDAEVYAFEPYPVNIKRLQTNIALNALKNVHIVPKALGAEVKEISFTVPENKTVSDTSSALPGFSRATYGGKIDWNSIKVPQTTIDDFFSKEELTSIQLLKIDVEGYEIPVLQGGMQTIQRYRPVILCEILAGNASDAFFAVFLKECRYSCYLIFKDGLIKLTSDLSGNIAGLNFLLLPVDLGNGFIPFSDSLIHKIMEPGKLQIG